MLLPLWLQIKKMFNVPMIVFMDDVLIFTQDQEQMTDIYVFLDNELSLKYHLKLNLNKTETGRFAAKSTDGKHFLSSTKANRIQMSHSGSSTSSATLPDIAEKYLLLLEKISQQLSQLTTLNRKLLRITEKSFSL